MYFAFAAIYVVLVLVFIVDVWRNPGLSTGGRVLWTVAVIVAPVLSWIVYGFWRLTRKPGFS
jgi:hypothetical protein